MNNKLVVAKLRFLIAIAAALFAGVTSFAQDGQFSINTSPLPAPTGHINDYAGVIDPETKQTLETALRNFKNTSNPQTEIAVAVVKTTGDRDIFDYSLAVARGWGIGSKEDDNPSALLFIAIDDRKYFTHVSKDLEDELPDGVVGSLQRQFLVPEFRKGNYAKGISDTIGAYIATIEQQRGVSGAPAATPQAAPEKDITFDRASNWCCCVIILLFVGLMIYGAVSKPPKNGGGSGGGGSGLGGVLPWIILSGASSSSGGSSWGGSDWGGSSGGGGWGGFGGGGDFGGGGAGGGW